MDMQALLDRVHTVHTDLRASYRGRQSALPGLCALHERTRLAPPRHRARATTPGGGVCHSTGAGRRRRCLASTAGRSRLRRIVDHAA